MNAFGIYLSSTDLWFLAVAGACCAWLIPHRLSISRERNNAFRIASIKFRESVLRSLSGLYPIPTNWPERTLEIIKILEDIFPQFQIAVTEFRAILPWHKRRGFDRAWRIYRLGTDGREIDGQYYWQYVPHSGESIKGGKHSKYDNTLTYKDEFKKNVDSLLYYAKST